jgi:hypothetical protein
MAKSKKNTEKAAVKIQDMAPAKDPKAGETVATVVTNLATQLSNMLHDTLKGIAQNIRA